MPNPKALLLVLAACLGAAATPASGTAAEGFPLKDGDIWVMAGDSITAQHLHSNYFEAFCFARYPRLKFAFRNSGVGGHTIPTTLARFDYDVAAWKPTVVSVELGMNDQGRYSVAQYIVNMGELSSRIKAIGARPVFFTASPVNNGDTTARLGGNTRLHQYAVALKSFAAKQHAPFADQFHRLIDVWGRNKPRENLARSLDNLKGLARDEHLAGVEHLRAFLAAQENSPHRPVSMQGDPVHPGPPGQLMMAAALLKELGADDFVSCVTLDVSGKVTDSKGCKVENVKGGQDTLAFDRLDQAVPFPIPDDARAVLSLDPTILDLSKYTLKVTGLADGKYLLKVNGKDTANPTAKELAAGVNLTAYARGPIADQGKQILTAVAVKEGVVNKWRGLSRQAVANAQLKGQLAELTRQVEAADAKIRAAATPRKLHFELVPMK